MNDEEKAAVLLLSLEEEAAASVMKNLRPAEIRRVGKFMSRITDIPGDVLKTVVKEFCGIAKEKGGSILVGDDVSRKIVQKALGEKEAHDLLADLESGRVGHNPILEKLRDFDPKMLMDFTKTEHPQTIALILAHLKPEQAAEVMENFSVEMQREISRRLATLQSVPNEFLEEVAKTLEKEIVVGKMTDQKIGGIKTIAEILNRMNRSNETAIMSGLEEMDPELATQIRALMFTFDDVLKLDDRSLQELLREISSEDLARALKVVDEGMREKFYRNMSRRGAEMLKEELEMMPPVRLSEVETSQRNILETVKKLEGEGRIFMMRGGDEDAFV
jgi:flagellar motor switch protein FliG